MNGVAHSVVEAPADAETARLGMWVFLAGEALFFGAVIVAYAVARSRSPMGFAAASAHTHLWLGTFNTALLLVSSGFAAVAAQAVAHGQGREARRGLCGAAALGLVFLVTKGIEYGAEWREGLFPGPGFRIDGKEVAGAQLFFAWYFVVTGLHAVHLAIGVVLCGLFARDAGRMTPDSPARVHALGLYWHFVDMVWIVLYPLIYLVAPRS